MKGLILEGMFKLSSGTCPAMKSSWRNSLKPSPGKITVEGMGETVREGLITVKH